MKKLCSRILFAVVVLASTCTAKDTTVLKVQKGPGMAWYLILIPATEFNDETILRLTNRYLSQASDLKLLQIAFYSDERSAYNSNGKSIDHVSFDLWKKREAEARMHGKARLAAEFLKCGESSTLRILRANGEISEIKIAGSNTFHPVLRDLTLNLLHVSFIDQGFGDARKLVPHFYFAVPRRISLGEADVLTKEFSNILGFPNFTLRLREDQWFIFDSFYPWMNPFARYETPPTLKGLAKSVEFICQPTSDEPCFQTALGTN